MRKKIMYFLPVFVFAFFAFTTSTQDDDDKKGKKIPSVTLKDMAGNSINTANASNDGNPIIISFWATWCKPCKQELNTIADEYEDWQEETGVKLIAVSVDDQKTTKMVEPYVNSTGWEYDIWLDVNWDFKRAMGVNIPPQSFIIDGEGNIVWSHVGFVPGDEEEMYDELIKIAGK